MEGVEGDAEEGGGVASGLPAAPPSVEYQQALLDGQPPALSTG
jgi:hypothetical protein